MPSREKTESVIREAYQLKFGNLYLHKKDDKPIEANHCYRVSPAAFYPDEDAPTPFNVNKVIESLEKSPQIETVTFCDNRQDVKWEGLDFDPRMRWHFSPPLRIELNFPVKNQEKTQFHRRSFGEIYQTSNRFEVFYDGAIYIICSALKDINKPCDGASDVNEFLVNLLEKEFRVEQVPPVPMREFYYLLFMSDKSREEGFETISKDLSRYEIALPISEHAIKRKKEILSHVLFSIREFLDVYYAGSMLSTHLENGYFEFSIFQREIQENTKKLLELPNYRLFQRRKIKNNLEGLLVNHYRFVVEFSLCSHLIREARANLSKLSERSGLPLFPFRKTLNLLIRNDLRYPELDIELHNTCLDYTKKLLERSVSWRLALYAAIFGAISALVIEYGPDIFNLLKAIVNSFPK